MVLSQTITDAARALKDAAPPGSSVILFGSHARGNAGPHSDLDFLVVEPEVTNRGEEMVRLLNAIGKVPFAVDVLVVSRKVFDHCRTTPNNVCYYAHREGRLLHELG